MTASTPPAPPVLPPSASPSGPIAGRDGWGIDEILLGFARAVRAAGLPVTADRERTFLVGAAAVGMQDRGHLYWTGRATLTSCPADLDVYDKVFTAWFSGERLRAGRPQEAPPRQVRRAPLEDGGPGGEEGPDDEVVRARASAQEVLRHRDVANGGGS